MVQVLWVWLLVWSQFKQWSVKRIMEPLGTWGCQLSKLETSTWKPKFHGIAWNCINMLFFYVFYIQRTQMHDLNIFEWPDLEHTQILVVLKDFVAKPANTCIAENGSINIVLQHLPSSFSTNSQWAAPSWGQSRATSFATALPCGWVLFQPAAF